MFPNDGRPGDVRNFVHKRIIGAVKGGVAGIIRGDPLGGAIGGFFGGGNDINNRLPVVPGFAVPNVPAFDPRRFLKPTGGCSPGFFRDSAGRCVPLGTRGTPIPGEALERALPFGQTGRFEFGDAVMGRFGAALEPGLRPSETRVCPRGTVLGVDGLCYNTRDIRNSERMWPRGRRPLLTGGEMRCISIAASAAKKIQKKTKQLQSMGMLKKPTSRRAPKLLHAHHEHSSHD